MGAFALSFRFYFLNYSKDNVLEENVFVATISELALKSTLEDFPRHIL